jgi:hypothetical protein
MESLTSNIKKRENTESEADCRSLKKKNVPHDIDVSSYVRHLTRICNNTAPLEMVT